MRKRNITRLILCTVSFLIVSCSRQSEVDLPKPPPLSLDITAKEAELLGVLGSPQQSTANASPIPELPALGLCELDTDLPLCSRLPESWDVEPWWRGFNDTTLHSLLWTTATNSYETQIAITQVQEAEIAKQQAFVSFLPSLLPQASYRESQASAATMPGIPVNALRNGFANLGVALAWEIDIFGRLRSLYQQSDAALELQREMLRDTLRLAVAAQARNYFQLKSQLAQLAVAKRRIAIAAERARLRAASVQAGELAAGDDAQALADEQRAVLTKEQLNLEVLRSLSAITNLSGEKPGTYTSLFLNNPLAAHSVFKGPLFRSRPEEFLWNRPDVSQARITIAHSAAGVDVATADLYPRLSLDASAGYGVISFRDIGRSIGEVYSIMPLLQWAIIDTGRISAQIDRTNVVLDRAMKSYKHALNRALHEVQNAVEGYQSLFEQRETARREVKVRRKEFERAKLMTSIGYSEPDILLERELQWLDAKNQRIQLDAALNLAIIDLVQAFGGGWKYRPLEAPNPDT